MKKRVICILAMLLIVLLLIIGISCCSGNSRGADDGEASTAPSTKTVTHPATSDVSNSEPETQPAETDPPATKPVEPEVPETLPSGPEVAEPEILPTKPEIPEATPSEPATPSAKPSDPPKEETPEVNEPVDTPTPVEYIQGNGYKRVKDFDPATNTGERSFYINGEGIFRIYEDEYIFEVTPETLTYEMWSSWDTHTQFSFKRFCHLSSDATLDERYNYRRITECENYTCGWENHYCYSEQGHQSLLEEMARGCYYCGKTDCIRFLARDASGFTTTDIYSCPEYDVYRDPSEYCQDCGYPKWGQAKAGEIYCSKVLNFDMACHRCGEMMYVDKCHHCVVPADYVPPDAHFHVYNKQITAPTCTQPGVARYVCSCGDSSAGEEIPSTGHAYGDWVVVKEATPGEQGVEEITCATCGKVLSRTFAFCADNDAAEAIARLLIDYINEYRAAEGIGAATTMEKCMVYAKIRSEQMAAKGAAEHNTADARAAATLLQYGTYVDPAEYGLPGEPYYHVNASEAVGMDGGTTAESVAAKFAEGFHNSAPHWSYMGTDSYIAVGMTRNSDGYWFCCIITSQENIDEIENGS